MTTLNLAIKANQATVIPALLVATLVNDTEDANIEIKFEDDIALKGDQPEESVQLVVEDASSVFGAVPVVEKLIELYPSLSTVHKNVVSKGFP